MNKIKVGGEPKPQWHKECQEGDYYDGYKDDG